MLECETECHNTKGGLAIKMQISAVSEVLGNSYCNRNADSETETDKSKLISLW